MNTSVSEPIQKNKSVSVCISTLPFMTSVGGQLLIRDGSTGVVLANNKDWTGLCVDNDQQIWLLGSESGERTFKLLQAKTLDAAYREVDSLAHQSRTGDRIQWELAVWHEIQTQTAGSVHDAQEILEACELQLDQHWQAGATPVEAAQALSQSADLVLAYLPATQH